MEIQLTARREAKRTGMLAAILGLCVLLFPNAQGQDSPQNSLIGFGAMSCAEFGRLYARDPTRVETLFYSWAQGWMSGIQAALPVQERTNLFGFGYGADEHRQFLRTYCADNPLRSFENAAAALFDHIRRLHGRPPATRRE